LDGPFEVPKKIGQNAYKVDLRAGYGVSATFNVADLSPYHDEDEGLPSLRTNSNQPGGNDGDYPLEPSEDHQACIKESASTNEIKEAHMFVQKLTYQRYIAAQFR